MSDTQELAIGFDGMKSPARLRLPAWRVSVLLRHIYSDITGFSQADRPRAVREGRTGTFEATRGALIAVAIMMALPAIMIVLSLLLRPQLHRWTNIVLGILYTSVMLVGMLPDGWMFYLLLGSIEIALTLAIVWFPRNRPARKYNEITIWKHA